MIRNKLICEMQEVAAPLFPFRSVGVLYQYRDPKCTSFFMNTHTLVC